MERLDYISRPSPHLMEEGALVDATSNPVWIQRETAPSSSVFTGVKCQ